MQNKDFTHGRMLKEIRRNLNISQKKLSEKLGISRGYVSEIETGNRRPSLKLRIRIKTMYVTHCIFTEPKPLVEVMTPEKPKLSWFKRLLHLFWRK